MNCKKPFFILLLMLLSSWSFQLLGDIAVVKDMRLLKKEAAKSQLPVLLLFSSENCAYCEAIRRDYLEPMQLSDELARAILFRQINMDEFNLIRGLNGKMQGGDDLALALDVDVAPTIIFIDANGQELAPRIVGLASDDYFDVMLRQHIASAIQNGSGNEAFSSN